MTFDISQLQSKELGVSGWILRVSAILLSRQLTPGLISPLPSTGRIAAVFIFFDRYAELDSTVLRHIDKKQFVGHSYLGITSGSP
jgi:hypothetical protein